MLDMVIDLLSKGCLILLLIVFAVIFVAIIFAVIIALIEIVKKNKIKNDTLKAMMDELDKLEKNK